ncbi:MAG: TetR family transcriptional regulator [Myxococcota bacterium]
MTREPNLPAEVTGPDAGASLPSFSAQRDREQAVLEASRAVVALFLRERSSNFSVRQLADCAGLSERTFYRYFPRKEDAIRPYVEAGLEHILSRVQAAPRTRSLRDVLVAAHAEILDAARAHEGEALLTVLNETERLAAVWLQVVTEAETAFARIVAERLGIPADSLQARFAGGVVVTAGRLALQSAHSEAGTRTPSQVFAECLDLLGPALLDQRALAAAAETDGAKRDG